MKRLIGLSLVLCFIGSVAYADKPESEVAPSDAVVMFNGKNLDGWMGREDLWSVEDGQIVGTTSDENPLQANTFLVYKKDQPGDFELTFQYKIEGGNSGVQYRSKVLDEKEFIVGGYQADIDFTNKFAGILYEERGRGILAQRGESVTIGEDGTKKREKFGDAVEMGNGIHPGKWNDYRVVANGNRLQHFINGAMTAEVIDNEASKSASKGVIAFQLHKGPPMVVRFKNITLHPVK